MPITALITGANRGIGFEIARQLTRRGFQVVIGARRIAEGQHAAERIQKEGGTARSSPNGCSGERQHPKGGAGVPADRGPPGRAREQRGHLPR